MNNLDNTDIDNCSESNNSVAKEQKKPDVILIDNYDSFTYNLVNQLRPLVNSLVIFRNSINIEKLDQKIEQLNNNCIIVISPGPGNPDSAGVTLPLIEKYKTKLPILGICLGHQAIVQSFSGKVGAAQSIVHGKGCDIDLVLGANTAKRLGLDLDLDSKTDSETDLIFKNLNSPFKAARYHSLAAVSMPSELDVIASCDNDVMAIKHVTLKILGFQFHPESILTPKGNQLMSNALEWLSEELHEPTENNITEKRAK